MFVKGAACNCFVFCLFSSSILNLYLHQKIIWFKPSLDYIIWEEEKKNGKGKGKKKSIKKLGKRSAGFLMCCCLSVARLSQLCMLLWTKHRDTHSWNHAGLMERLAWTPSPGTRGSCWVLWKTREAKPSRFLYNSYTLPLLCFLLYFVYIYYNIFIKVGDPRTKKIIVLGIFTLSN